MHIEIIAGSPRKESLSLRVAKHLLATMHEQTTHYVGLISLNEVSFPFIEKVWQSAADAPAELVQVAARMFAAEAFIVVSPEYNGSYSPALKNLFDHFPKQNRKPFGLATSSDGAFGGMRAAQQLLLMVPALRGIPSPTLLIVPEVDKKFDEKGNLQVPAFRSKIDDFIKDFLWLAEKLHG